jgi:hypothetical protein
LRNRTQAATRAEEYFECALCVTRAATI